MKKVTIISLALTVFMFIACSKDNEQDTDPTPDPDPVPGSCDTANMKYTANVVPILQSNCYGCHGANTNSGGNGIILEGYANIETRAKNGTLIGVITHASGFPAMPKDGPKLSECNINKIKSWVNHGAENN